MTLTQTDRVLRSLRQRGSDGVDPTDFFAPHTLDGGPPITRLAARVKDLRARGYTIETRHIGRLARYVLTDGPAIEPSPAPAPGPPPLTPPALAPTAPVISEEQVRAVRPGRARQRSACASETTGRLFHDSIGAAPPRSALDPQELDA